MTNQETKQAIVYLTEEQHLWLKKQKEEKVLSMTAIIRGLINKEMRKSK